MSEKNGSVGGQESSQEEGPVKWEQTSDIADLRSLRSGSNSNLDTVSELSSFPGSDINDDPKKKKRSLRSKVSQKFSRKNKESEAIDAGLLTNDELAQAHSLPPSGPPSLGGRSGQEGSTPGGSGRGKKWPFSLSRGPSERGLDDAQAENMDREHSWKRPNKAGAGDDVDASGLSAAPPPAAPQPLRATLPFPRGVHMPQPQPQMNLEDAQGGVGPRAKAAEGLEDLSAGLGPGPRTAARPPTRPQRSLPLRKTSSRPEVRGKKGADGVTGVSVVDQPDKSIPRYKQWRGNNVFFFSGKLMVGVHYRQLLLTLTMIAATWTAFYALVGAHLEWPYLLAGAALMAASVAFLLVTALRDPGIIPRHPPSQLVESMPPEMKEKMNYCPTCHIVRPPRTKHCRHCNNCIQTFDHHCPWTGNCIGRRNYRFFYLFLMSITASSAYVLVMSANYLTRHLTDIDSKYFDAIFKDEWKIKGGQFIAPLLILWTLLVTTLVGALLVFHIILLGRGQTTNEYLRGEKNRGDIPHGNIFTNCGNLWCHDMPESRLLPMWEHPGKEDDDRNLKAAVDAMSSLQEAMQARTEDDFFHEEDDDDEGEPGTPEGSDNEGDIEGQQGTPSDGKKSSKLQKFGSKLKRPFGSSKKGKAPSGKKEGAWPAAPSKEGAPSEQATDGREPALGQPANGGGRREGGAAATPAGAEEKGGP